MILLVGIPGDLQIALMTARLNAMGVEFRHLDQLKVPREAGYGLHFDGNGVSGWVRVVGGDALPFEEITGVYARYVTFHNDHRPIEGAPNHARDSVNQEIGAQLMAVCESISGPVVTRPSVSLSNDSKPFQKMVIGMCGFLTPNSIVTSDPDAARSFVDDCDGLAVIKSASSIRSRVRLFGSQHLNRLERIRNCPIHLEEYVEGLDIRVHTIGDRVFATQVERDVRTIDYRYTGTEIPNPNLEPLQLSPSLEAGCVRMADEFGLPVAGIDLRRTPSGDIYCFEVNTSPAFASYELATAQPISAAVIEYLSERKGSTPPVRV